MKMITLNSTEMNECSVVYERFDSAYGVVTDTCNSGAFLRLENGESAFAYKFSSLRPGTEVLCSIQKLADGDRYARVSVDSVLFYPSSKVS